MSFGCQKERDTLTFGFHGDIDEFSCRGMRGEIDELIAAERPSAVVFDLSDVGFVDSTGLGLILGRYKKLSAAGGVLKLKNVPPQIDKVFRASGVYSALEKVK